MSKYHSLTAKVAPDMDQERLASLVLKLETAIIKKLDKLPSTAPIAAQLVESLNNIKAELEPKAGLTGRDAVEAFLRAVEGHFLPDFPPLKALARKYPEIVVDSIGGKMSLPAIAAQTRPARHRKPARRRKPTNSSSNHSADSWMI